MTDTLYDLWHTRYAGNFAAGVQLLMTNAPRAVTVKILQRLQTFAATGAEVDDYHLAKLESALRNTPNQAGTDATIAANADPRVMNFTMPRAAFPHIRVESAIPLHKEHSFVHALLVHATTDEERAKYARQIVEDIVPRLDAIYDAARDQASGQTDDGANTETRETGGVAGVNLLRKLNSLRTRVSLLQKKLIPNAPGIARKAELEKELEMKQAEIKRIEAQI